MSISGIGGRFNAVHASMPAVSNAVTINRYTASAGWFLTRNIMLKGEYVNQVYNKFAVTDIRAGSKFNGWMIEAVVAF